MAGYHPGSALTMVVAMSMAHATVLLTRPRQQAEPFAERLRHDIDRPLTLLSAPMTQILEETGEFSTDGLQGLLFTSVNAVEIFASRSTRRDLPALCVGDRTAETARSHGMSAESARGDASALATLAQQAYRPGAGDYLHLRGRQSTGDVAGALAVEGINVHEVVLYDATPIWSVPPDVQTSLEAGRIDAALFFSPRASRIFTQLASAAAQSGRAWGLQRATAVAISSAAAQPLRELDIGAIQVATAPDSASVVSKLQELLVTFE